MKIDRGITVRFEEDMHVDLSEFAKKNGMSVGGAVRIFVKAGLLQYDARHEEVLHKFDSMNASFEAIDLMLGAVILAAARLDVARIDQEKAMDWKAVSENVKDLLKRGKPVSEAVKAGVFK